MIRIFMPSAGVNIRRLGSAERRSGRWGWFNVRFSLAEGLSKSDLRRVNVRGSGGRVFDKVSGIKEKADD